MTPAAQNTIERVALDALEPDPDNARAHGRDNLRAIAASLERFGQVRPLLVSAGGVVIAGNGTFLTMQKLGWTEADVIRLPWEDAATCRAYAIADNRTAELASWDSSVLGGQVEEMTAAGIPMDALGFGFLNDKQHEAPTGPAGDSAGGSDSSLTRSYRCPACGFRWRYADGGDVVPL